jgi:hypothetical protein
MSHAAVHNRLSKCADRGCATPHSATSRWARDEEGESSGCPWRSRRRVRGMTHSSSWTSGFRETCSLNGKGEGGRLFVGCTLHEQHKSDGEGGIAQPARAYRRVDCHRHQVCSANVWLGAAPPFHRVELHRRQRIRRDTAADWVGDAGNVPASCGCKKSAPTSDKKRRRKEFGSRGRT